jgi:hypothetical protein
METAKPRYSYGQKGFDRAGIPARQGPYIIQSPRISQSKGFCGLGAWPRWAWTKPRLFVWASRSQERDQGAGQAAPWLAVRCAFRLLFANRRHHHRRALARPLHQKRQQGLPRRSRKEPPRRSHVRPPRRLKPRVPPAAETPPSEPIRPSQPAAAGRGTRPLLPQMDPITEAQRYSRAALGRPGFRAPGDG